MRDMKDSGMPFCKLVPIEWSVIPNRYLFIGHSMKVGEKSNEYQLLSLTTNGVKEKDINASGGKVPTSYDNYQTVEKGDMIFCLFDLDCSAVFSGLSSFDGMITSAYDVFKPNEKYIDKHFIEYWFAYVFSNRYYKMYSKSIRYTITSDMFKNILSPVPPIEQQRVIGNLLDEKCTQIDALIANQQKQIEKLKAYKQSLITETVTKGLNPDVPMKDSGVEWIGEIPEQCSLLPMKYLAEAIGDGIHSTPNYDINGNIFFINGNNIGEEQLHFKDSTNRLNANEYANYKAPLLTDNTILITLNGATYGKTSFYNNEPVLLGKSAGYITLKPYVNKRYIRYYLQSSISKLIMDLSLAGTTIQNVSLRTLNTFTVVYPQINEQDRIVTYLDHKCSHIDKLIALKQQKIEKLQQYKKSVIYEYVTGKKEVK